MDIVKKTQLREAIIARMRDIPKWSDLRTFGKSKLLSLTVIVPLIGWIILFNNQFVDLISISPDIFRRLSAKTVDTSGFERHITIGWLKFTYFGLSLLGVSSLLYTILCPKLIKNNDSESDYIAREKSLSTPSRIGIILNSISRHYTKDCHFDNTLRYILISAASPQVFHTIYKSVIHEMWETPAPEVDGAEGDIEADADLETGRNHDDELYSINGNLNISYVAECICTQRRAQRNIWMPMYAVAPRFDTDILTIEYLVSDNSRPMARATILLLYVFGFAITSWPSISTFLSVIMSIL